MTITYYAMALIIIILWFIFTVCIKNKIEDSFGAGEFVKTWVLSAVLAIFVAGIVAILGTVLSLIILIAKLVYKIKSDKSEASGDGTVLPDNEIIRYIIEKQWVTVVAAIYAIISISFFATNLKNDNNGFKDGVSVETKNNYTISEKVDDYKKYQHISEKESEVSETAENEKGFIYGEITTIKETDVVYDESMSIKEPEVSETEKSISDISEIDSDGSVILTLNSDKSINVKFVEEPCSLTLPASWGNKVVIREGRFYYKGSYYNGEEALDGLLFSLIFSDEEQNSWPFKSVGKSGDKYYYVVRPSDCRIDPFNEKEYNEYNMMSEEYFDYVQDSIVCESLDISLPIELNPVLYGHISSGGREIEGYTTSYVCEGKEKSVQWICQDTWHITAFKTFYAHGVQWYECWDTDDGDYYGWIDGNFLAFYDDNDINVGISDYLGSWNEVTGIRVFIEVSQLDSENVKISVHGSGGASISYNREYIGSISGDGTIYFSGESYTTIYNDDGTSYVEDYVDGITGRMSLGKTGLLSLTVDGSDEYEDEYFEKNFYR